MVGPPSFGALLKSSSATPTSNLHWHAGYRRDRCAAPPRWGTCLVLLRIPPVPPRRTAGLQASLLESPPLTGWSSLFLTPISHPSSLTSHLGPQDPPSHTAPISASQTCLAPIHHHYRILHPYLLASMQCLGSPFNITSCLVFAAAFDAL